MAVACCPLWVSDCLPTLSKSKSLSKSESNLNLLMYPALQSAAPAASWMQTGAKNFSPLHQYSRIACCRPGRRCRPGIHKGHPCMDLRYHPFDPDFYGENRQQQIYSQQRTKDNEQTTQSFMLFILLSCLIYPCFKPIADVPLSTDFICVIRD